MFYLISKHKVFFTQHNRIVLTGKNIWGKETMQTHTLLNKNGLKHHYDDSLTFPHRWDKAWMIPTLDALIRLTKTGKIKSTKNSLKHALKSELYN